MGGGGSSLDVRRVVSTDRHIVKVSTMGSRRAAWSACARARACVAGAMCSHRSCRLACQVWDATSGAAFTSIQPAGGADINDALLWPGSGLLLLGCDAPRVGAFFIPALGPAPAWCSFLESLTEELAEAAPTPYDDYR